MNLSPYDQRKLESPYEGPTCPECGNTLADWEDGVCDECKERDE